MRPATIFSFIQVSNSRTIVPVDEKHFRVRVLAAVSPQFFGWVAGIGDKMCIGAPEHVKEAYREYLLHILEGYG